jgi:hypothetical protein
MPEVIIIVDIVCYDQVRSEAMDAGAAVEAAVASPCLAARALLSGCKISAGVSLRTPSLSEWPGLGLCWVRAPAIRIGGDQCDRIC